MSMPTHPARRAGADGARAAGGAFQPYLTPYGSVTIRSEGSFVTDVALGDVRFDGTRKPSAASNRAATEIQEYLAGKRRSFDVDVAPRGSAFQRSVWEAVGRIPYGQTRTCSQIAEELGCPESFRAVGSAVRKNPLAFLVPAHRVVGTAGKPLGSGREAQVKGALLRMEQRALADGGAVGTHRN